MNEYYQILGIEQGADQTEIKKAYFRLVRQYTPEKDPEMFRKIREAYEQLKKGAGEELGPQLPEPKEPLAQMMLKQIGECRRSGRNQLLRDTCEEAVKRFPEEIIFRYHLMQAQRMCGNTGKAVKNAQFLVQKDPDNKWFQRELAISYITRGYVNKAFPVCERAYELGCRDLDFVLLYAKECDSFGEEEKGIKVLLDLLRSKSGWSKEEVPDLVELLAGLLSMDMMLGHVYFQEILDEMTGILERYRIFLAEYVDVLSIALVQVGGCYEGRNKRVDDQVTGLLDLLGKMADTEQARMVVSINREEYRHRRVYADDRLPESLENAFDFFCDKDELESGIRKYAQLDTQLCMLEQRREILAVEDILQQEYPDFYEQIRGFLDKLKDEERIPQLKERLKSDYERASVSCSGGVYYEWFPQEKRQVKVVHENAGFGDTPYVRQGKKIGRNDPCPCGSGKKYKQCCMKK